jgi:molecular chaperone DnaK
MANIAVGIDLGTSNSCVAISRGGRVDVLPNAFGESTTASVVNVGEDGSITVGNAAKANIIHDPHNTIYSSKRLIGRYFFSDEVKKARAVCSYEIVEGEGQSVRIKIRDEVFSLPEIGAMILRELKSIAESRLGQPAARAVVTVPAYFNDNQRQATKDAARIAGLDVLRILNEPTAAALAYGFGRGLDQRVAVYDLGGGTFDISVLEIGADVFEVLATAGDTFLGGDDFDDRVIDLLADEFMQREGINLRNDPYALEKLKVAAEDAKKALSMEEEVDIRIPDVIVGPDGTARSIERKLTTQDFGALVSDLLQRSFKVCDEALQQAGIMARDIDGVILVGGPTRLPVIRNAVREYFQQEPLTDVDPDEVVAMGAAIHAESLMSEETESVLLDVTPLSLQIGVAGGLTEPVIDRNTPVPIEQTRTFTTFKDHQQSVAIRVYQGESREASENAVLGQFEFSGFQTGRRDEVEIDVTFEIDTDGIVSVTAKDRRTGEQASTRLTLSSGLSDTELSSIIERGVADRVETRMPAPATASPADTSRLEETIEGEELHADAADDLLPDADMELVPLSPEDLDLESAPDLDLAAPEDLDFTAPDEFDVTALGAPDPGPPESPELAVPDGLDLETQPEIHDESIFDLDPVELSEPGSDDIGTEPAQDDDGANSVTRVEFEATSQQPGAPELAAASPLVAEAAGDDFDLLLDEEMVTGAELDFDDIEAVEDLSLTSGDAETFFDDGVADLSGETDGKA